MKLVGGIVVVALCAGSVVARADGGKTPAAAVKADTHGRGLDVGGFVVDKDAPSADKTVPLGRVRSTSKNK